MEKAGPYTSSTINGQWFEHLSLMCLTLLEAAETSYAGPGEEAASLSFGRPVMLAPNLLWLEGMV